jgi:hypothetical protein
MVSGVFSGNSYASTPFHSHVTAHCEMSSQESTNKIKALNKVN